MSTVEILTIGDELLRGELVDTNASWLASQIAEAGCRVQRISSVGDTVVEIAAAVREAASRSALVITTGGLGPTDDDRTSEAVAHAAGVVRERREEAISAIRARFARRALAYSANNDRQGYLPQGSDLLPNDKGTAPGFALTIQDSRVICFPGVPSEMRWMFETYALAELTRAFGPRVVQRRVFKLFGLGESQVDARLTRLLDRVPAGYEVSLHYRATFPEVHVTLIGHGHADQPLGAVLDELGRVIDERVGEHIFTRNDASFADVIVASLQHLGATVALAESCTAGAAADLLTRAAGASDVFQLGIVAYANRAKQEQLGVSLELLTRHGAVSRPCVEAMARGIREKAGADYGVAISGVAGPGGGTAEKPVGTVHFAVATREDVRHLMRVFPFDRQHNKLVSAYVAFWLLLKQLGAIPTRSIGDPLGGRWGGQKS